MEEEPKPENEEKKLKIVGTVLQNMGVGTRAASVVAVPGLNVRFHPIIIQEHCNAYLVDHWVQEEPRPLLGARVGWARRFDALEGKYAVIYSMTADNPRPDVEITSIDVKRLDTRGAFAVLAITAGEVVR